MPTICTCSELTARDMHRICLIHDKGAIHNRDILRMGELVNRLLHCTNEDSQPEYIDKRNLAIVALRDFISCHTK